MPIYTIIAGVNGCGKSSLTGALKAERADLGVIIDVDKLTVEAGGDRFLGGKEAIHKINDCLKKGLDFTQETTLSGLRTEKTIQRARQAGYQIRLYYIGLNSAEESIKRIQNRVAKGGHNIPQDVVERRFSSRFEDISRILFYCNEAIFYDNDNGFRVVGEYRNGEILQIGESCPHWLYELQEIVSPQTTPLKFREKTNIKVKEEK